MERPSLLDGTIRQKHDLQVSARLLGNGNDIGWMTLPKALTELETMLAGAAEPDLMFLREHHQFLRDRHTTALRVHNRFLIQLCKLFGDDPWFHYSGSTA